MTAEILNVIDTDEAIEAALRESEREIGRLKIINERLQFENEAFRREIQRLQQTHPSFQH